MSLLDAISNYVELKGEAKIFLDEFHSALAALESAKPDYDMLARALVTEVRGRIPPQVGDLSIDFAVDKKIRVNDVVEGIGQTQGKNVHGVMGRVVSAGQVIYGVEWAKDVGGSDCGGRATPGHGLYVNAANIRKIGGPLTKQAYESFAESLAGRLADVESYEDIFDIGANDGKFPNGTMVKTITDVDDAPKGTIGQIDTPCGDFAYHVKWGNEAVGNSHVRAHEIVRLKSNLRRGEKVAIFPGNYEYDYKYNDIESGDQGTVVRIREEDGVATINFDKFATRLVGPLIDVVEIKLQHIKRLGKRSTWQKEFFWQAVTEAKSKVEGDAGVSQYVARRMELVKLGINKMKSLGMPYQQILGAFKSRLRDTDDIEAILEARDG